MPSSDTPDKGLLQTDAQGQLASGCGALRLTKEQERKLESLDDAIERGIADIHAGRTQDLDEMCDELISELGRLPDYAAH